MHTLASLREACFAARVGRIFFFGGVRVTTLLTVTRFLLLRKMDLEVHAPEADQ